MNELCCKELIMSNTSVEPVTLIVHDIILFPHLQGILNINNYSRKVELF